MYICINVLFIHIRVNLCICAYLCTYVCMYVYRPVYSVCMYGCVNETMDVLLNTIFQE
jgi:hypothetical protein